MGMKRHKKPSCRLMNVACGQHEWHHTIQTATKTFQFTRVNTKAQQQSCYNIRYRLLDRSLAFNHENFPLANMNAYQRVAITYRRAPVSMTASMDEHKHARWRQYSGMHRPLKHIVRQIIPSHKCRHSSEMS